MSFVQQSAQTHLDARPSVASTVVDVVTPPAVDTAAAYAGSGIHAPITAAGTYEFFSGANHASSDDSPLSQGGTDALSKPCSEDDELLALLDMCDAHTGSIAACAPEPAPHPTPAFLATAPTSITSYVAQLPYGAFDRNPASTSPFGPPLTTLGEFACGAAATTTARASAFSTQSLHTLPATLQLPEGLTPHLSARCNIVRFLSTPSHSARNAVGCSTPSQIGVCTSAGDQMKTTSSVPSWAIQLRRPQQSRASELSGASLAPSSDSAAQALLKLGDEDMVQGLYASASAAAVADSNATLQPALGLMDPDLANAVHRVTMQGRVSAMDALRLIAHVGFLDDHNAKLLPLEVTLLLWTRETLAAPPSLHRRVQHTARDICLRMGLEQA